MSRNLLGVVLLLIVIYILIQEDDTRSDEELRMKALKSHDREHGAGDDIPLEDFLR
jgi:hypothetical protein